MIQNPPQFILFSDLQKAAFSNGFRIERGSYGGWLKYASANAQGNIWIAGESPLGPWYLSVDHPGVAAELGVSSGSGPGLVTDLFASLNDLYEVIGRCYQLGVSLPDAPLELYRKHTFGMPSSTEAERLVKQRVGQDIFRAALFEYWDGRCPLTGIADKALLRASHIVPWAECDDDAQRLDVHNGLLLSALWDAAFDAGMVSFSDLGEVLMHRSLRITSRNILLADAGSLLLMLTAKHRSNLARHRAHFHFN